MKIKSIISVILISALPFGHAFAADGQALYTSKTCGACHGLDANSPIMPVYPKLLGQTKEYLIAQMLDIKSGARSNGQSAAMKGIMAMVSEEEIAAIAEYIAGL